MARQDLLAERHGTPRGGGRSDANLPLQPGDIVVEQAVVLDDAARDLSFARGEDGQGDLLAAPHLVDQGEIGRGQDPEVLAVFVVDALDTLGRSEERRVGKEWRS